MYIQQLNYIPPLSPPPPPLSLSLSPQMLYVYKDYFEHIQGLFVSSKKLEKSPREIWQEIKENHYTNGTLVSEIN